MDIEQPTRQGTYLAAAESVGLGPFNDDLGRSSTLLSSGTTVNRDCSAKSRE